MERPQALALFADRDQRRKFLALALPAAIWGFAYSLDSAAAPAVAESFGLDEVAIQSAFGLIALSSLATFLIARQLDRLGRRRIVIWTFGLLPLTCVAAAAAPSIGTYVAARFAMCALGWALAAGITVMIAEELPTQLRSSGQAAAVGLLAYGGGNAFAGVAICAHFGWSWRYLWLVAAVVALLTLPFVVRNFPESRRFSSFVEDEGARRGRLLELLEERYRRRVLGLFSAQFLLDVARTTALMWSIYYPVHTLGLAMPGVIVAVLCGGLVGGVGLPIGAFLSERWGRRGCFASGALLLAFSGVGYYTLTGQLTEHVLPALGIWFALLSTAERVAEVSVRSSATELLPIRLRGAANGISSIVSSSAIAVGMFAGAALSPLLGGIPGAVALLSLLSVPAAVIFLACVSETANLTLEQAALEDLPADA